MRGLCSVLSVFVICVMASACAPKKKAAEESASVAELWPGFNGLWFSDCLDMSGEGALYARMLTEVKGLEQSYVLYSYGSNAGCTGTASLISLKGEPATGLMPIVIYKDVLSFTGQPDGFFVGSFLNPGDALTDLKIQMYYKESEDVLYSPLDSIIASEFSGTTWNDLVAADSGLFSGFASDHTRGLRFERVTEAPAL